MITNKEFAILKTCLRYAIEELGPHCPHAFASYLTHESVEKSELITLARKLASGRLAYLDLSTDRPGIVEPGSLLKNNVWTTNLATVLIPAAGQQTQSASDSLH